MSDKTLTWLLLITAPLLIVGGVYVKVAIFHALHPDAPLWMILFSH